MDEVCFKCGKPAGDGIALDAYGVTGKSVCLPCVGDLAVFYMGRTYEECRSVRDLKAMWPVTSTSGTHYEVTAVRPASWSGVAAAEEEATRQMTELMRQSMEHRLGR